MSIEPTCNYCGYTDKLRCRSVADTETCKQYAESIKFKPSNNIKGGPSILNDLSVPKIDSKATREQLGNQYTRLVPLEAIAAAAASFEYGANKYAARNWEKGLPWQTMIDSLKRHIEDFERGSDYDDGELGSGLHQTCMIMASAMMLCASVIRNIGEDDRVPNLPENALSAKECLKWLNNELDSKEDRLAKSKTLL